MKKLVIKTVAFTLALMLGVGGIFYLALSLIKPSTLGDFYFRLNSQTLTIKYSEKAYQKSQDISDLSLLTERAIIFENHELIQKYAVTLINDSGYNAFAKTKSASYHYYIVSGLCLSLYESNKKGEAVSTAISHTDDYTQSNPIRFLIAKCVEQNDRETLIALRQGLIDRGDKNQLVNQDISSIDEFLDN